MQTIFAPTALLDDGWAKDVLVGIDDDGRIADVRISYPGDLETQMLEYSSPRRAMAAAMDRQ